jgi:DNA-binding NarL/FixJ family response regulator
MTIDVLIADDQALVRAGFTMIIDADEELRVVAEAADGAEAIEHARRSRPDIVLMDIRMPVLDGLEATRRILDLDDPPRVLMLTTFDLDEYVFDALVAGASGFLLKDVTPEGLRAAIRTVASGDSLLAPSITRRLIEVFVDDHRSPLQLPKSYDSLTARERETLALLARGLSNSEIAEQLYLSTATVKSHVARLLEKLQLRDRVQAVIFAYEAGVVRPNQPDTHDANG